MSSITIMTTQGRAQLAAAVANAQTFPSAKIAVGDGNGATYVPNEAQVGLVHEVWRGNATVARTDDRVIFQAVLPAEVGGFTVREVGVLIGEVGAEQLFIISQHPSTEKIAAPANGSGPLPITIVFSATAAEQAVLPIGSSDNATLQLSRAPHITVDGLVTEPPAEPADGSLYAIDAAAAGLFVGKGGWLVERVAGAWIYKQPPEKSVIRLAASGAWYQRDGADWVVLTFEDTSILWEQIQDPPAEFPPSAHNHDDRYFTEAETAVLLAGKSNTDHLHDDRYLRLIGGTATGEIAAPGFRATSGGQQVYLRQSGGVNRIDSYNDPITATVPLVINSSELRLQIADGEQMRIDGAGNVGLGTSTPAGKLDVAGITIVRDDVRIGKGAYPKLLLEATGNAADAKKVQIYVTPGSGAVRIGHLNDAENAEMSSRALETSGGLTINGPLSLAGDAGVATKVMTGNPSGVPAWKALSELGVGRKIVAVGRATGASAAITFASAEPDTSYEVAGYGGWGGSGDNSGGTSTNLSLSSKSTGGCTVNITDEGGGSPTGTVRMFYVIFRNT